MAEKRIGDMHLRCGNCAKPRSDHRLANFADGPQIGEAFLVCPTAIFKDPYPEDAK